MNQFPSNPGKLDAESIVTPEQTVGNALPDEVPTQLLLCYDDRLLADLAEFYDLTPVEVPRWELFRFEETSASIGIAGGIGIGAPAAAMALEEFVAAGTQTVLSIGFAGCLDPDIESDAFIVCDSAIRDEGTSHHYLDAGRTVAASSELIATAEETLSDVGKPFRTGTSWTLDAFYRETPVEIESYAVEGVLTVEMEAAAVFAVAARRGVDAAALFAVSDYLTPTEWIPRRRGTRKDLVELAATARRVLEGHGGG